MGKNGIKVHEEFLQVERCHTKSGGTPDLTGRRPVPPIARRMTVAFIFYLS